ncbi:MAG: flagellar biosynthesis protein FlhB [Pseudomonadota bacterium]
MADDTDQSEKTEEPTSRKLEKAREQGQVAKSQEVSHWFMLLGLAIFVGLFMQQTFAGMGEVLVSFLAQPEAFSMDAAQLSETALETTLQLALVLAVPMTIIFFSGILSGVIQNGLLFTPEQIKPKLSNIGFKRGFKKIFSLNALMEFTKGIIKLIIVSVVVGILVWPDKDHLMTIATMETGSFLLLLQSISFKVVLAVLAIMTVITIADVLYQRFQHHKQQRMSKQEIKDENKQAEGDPIAKSRLRQIRLERARQRMMAAVPEADVVVTNPTHFAVALKYEQESMEAPRLVAKGVDTLAFKIREVAKENDVPVVENPPLARALYSGVELDQEIPPEHYKAVAEVISYVMRLKGKLRSAAARR